MAKSIYNTILYYFKKKGYYKSQTKNRFIFILSKGEGVYKHNFNFNGMHAQVGDENTSLAFTD